MTQKYGAIRARSNQEAYCKAIGEISPIVENAVYLMSGKNSIATTAGLHCSSRSASSSSSSPCRATSLDSRLKD